MALDLHRIRSQFPSLARVIHGKPAAFLDGPAGTQVPQRVIDSISLYLLRHNANHGGYFATSQESDAIIEEARRAAADLLGVDDPDCICFGANMTTITLHVSRALARTWGPGDEILVSDSDHDANVTPWVLAARDAGAIVRRIGIRRDDCTLDLDHLASQLTDRTRLVAVGAASNATGTIHSVDRISAMAHAAGALVYVDAVHFAPHGPMDAAVWNADFVVCSAYKFFGPHVGALFGKRALLESLPAYKARPASEAIPDRWMTGTQNHECIAGVLAAIEYLVDLAPIGKDAVPSDRRSRLVAAMREIASHERFLADRFIQGVLAKPHLKIWGIDDVNRLSERVPTFSITSQRERPVDLARRLAKQGIFTWSGNFYALPLTEALGLEPDGMLRIGFVHYNTVDEVDRCLELL